MRKQHGIAALLCVAALVAWIVCPQLALADSDGVDASPQAMEEAAGSSLVQEALDEASPPAPRFRAPEGVDYEPGVVLVTTGEHDVQPSELRQRIIHKGVASVDAQSVRLVANDLYEVHVIAPYTVEDAVNELESSGAVKSAEPDYLFELANDIEVVEVPLELDAQADESLSLPQTLGLVGTPNDPYATYQWALSSVNAYDAWANPALAASNEPVGIAILDIGFQASHSDLADHVVATYNAFADSQDGSSAENIANVNPPTGGDWDHGTHVAGIVGAVTNNEQGVASVSNNKVRLILIRIMDDKNRGTSAAMVKGFDFAIEHQQEYNIRVVNMSVGQSTSKPVTQIGQSVLRKIDEAYSRGIVTVASAGNNSASYPVPFINWPGDYQTTVSVINLENTANESVANSFENVVEHLSTNKASYLYATTNGKSVRRFWTSNYNRADEQCKNISAPGTNILSTFFAWSGDVTYGLLTGTSMSAPVVAGTLGLVFSANPSLTAEEAVAVLYDSARDIGAEGWDSIYGYGEVDAQAAVEASVSGVVSGPAFVGVDGQAHYDVVSYADGWSFESSDPSVLAVDEQGNAQGIACGVATVVARRGGQEASVDVVVLGPMSGDALVSAGGSAQFAVEQPNSSGPLAWTWVSSDEDVATVTSSGVVHGHEVGTTTITATLVADENVSFSRDVSIYEPLLGIANLAVGHTVHVNVTPEIEQGQEPLPTVLSTTWTSSDEAIATVDDGTVLGVSAGEATITRELAFDDGSTDTRVLLVRVYGPLAGADSLTVKESATLCVERLPKDLQDGWVWSSSDEGVVTVDQTGKVLAVGIGMATITATLETSDSVSFSHGLEVYGLDLAQCEVSVPDRTYEGSAIEPEPMVTYDGEALVLHRDYEVDPSSCVNAGSYQVTLRAMGTVYEGSATATFTITKATLVATYADEKILCGDTPAAKVKVSGFVGKDTAADALDYVAPTVRISKKKRNTVGSYVLTPSGGSAANYAFSYCPGTLVVSEVPVRGVSVNKASLKLKATQTATLKVEVTPTNATQQTVVWKSSNPKVATVSSKGVVKAVSVGRATITAKVGKKSAKCSVTVWVPAASVTYRANVERKGWQGWRNDGATSGTVGKSRCLEAIKVKLDDAPFGGGIRYRTCVQGVGWQGWKRNGATSGAGSPLLEAVQIELTGQMARYYDVYYRVHVQRFGWMGWTKNGARAGTEGYAYRLEAVEVRLVPKGDAAPGSTTKPFRKK